jgi:hypothetical protein
MMRQQLMRLTGQPCMNFAMISGGTGADFSLPGSSG